MHARVEGRTIDVVRSAGKHLLVEFSGDLVLRTHMRMHGSWHLYYRGDRWRRPRRDMRIVIETGSLEAVGFSIPVAELIRDRSCRATRCWRRSGPICSRTTSTKPRCSNACATWARCPSPTCC
ncbi:MAG: hypothetical protein H0X67_20590 [Acidobacteria bacterium]|nr:hypothetical protein [Acidobacteriota bacterium]